MKSPDIIKAHEAEIRKMFSENVRVADIGARFGISHFAVRRIFAKLGLKRPRVPPPHVKTRIIFEENKATIEKMLFVGFSHKMIGEHFGVSKSAAQGWIRYHLPRQPRGKPSMPKLRAFSS